MLKIACLLTGDRYSCLEGDTPASKKKVVALALAMLVPTLIWTANGFLLSHVVLQAGLLSAVITALACGVIIFLTEKLIVMANGNWMLTALRIFIGFGIALLGSIAIDEVVFKDDIDIQVQVLKEKAIEEAKKRAEEYHARTNNLNQLEEQIRVANNEFNIAERGAIAESDGSSGTGNVGIGAVARLKNQKALERKADLLLLQNKQSQFELEKKAIVEESAKKAEDSFKENGLLTRVKALFELVEADKYMKLVYWLLTIVLFFFEFLVVILKLTWRKTNYERRLEFIEELGEKRIDFLRYKNLAIIDPGYYHSSLVKTRLLLENKRGNYN